MKKIKLSIFFIALFCALTFRMVAVPAYPLPIVVSQPDGTTISIMIKGDEYHHYFLTEDGYLITKGENNIYNYARVNEKGEIVDTGIKANDLQKRSASEISKISNFEKYPDFSKKNQLMRDKRKLNDSSDSSRFPLQGSPRSLVILAAFSDVDFIVPNTNQAFTNLLNEAGYSANGGTGSAADYFRQASNEIFTPVFDVVGPYTLPQKMDYYGGNDAYGNDKKTIQMVIDACNAANNDGLDFTIYDTDNNGIIDNVFIYYAGYNEAEGGGANTIWPHRWTIMPGYNYNGTIESITFDGKQLRGYACTSELRGNSANGGGMCGIGTFVHEFGHVLGLPDFYATNGANHHTLSFWDVMDAGPYLNQGRTPPTYNSYERFSLGFMVPTLIDNNLPQYLSLNPLITNNEAYLLSSTTTHNLIPNNPFPREFFMLENRQKTGFDSYLPGHGMLIYRVNYNKTDWDNNGPNNQYDKMGLDIMEADEIETVQSLPGDPFPGTSNVNIYEFVLRNGTKIYKKATNIVESNNVVSFSLAEVNKNPGSPDIMITEVYGGGGTSGATLRNDFIELFNITHQDVNISGWSIQVFSSTGTGTPTAANTYVFPENSIIPARAHYLIQCAAGSGGGEDLPTPDAVTNISLGTTSGKVILYTTSAPQTISTLTTIIESDNFKDYVPYGTTAKPIWGSSTSAVTGTTSASRILNDGKHYAYTRNIGKDFEIVAPNPANSSHVISGIFSTEVEKLSVTAVNGKINFSATAGEKVEIYNTLGQRLHQSVASEGINEIALSETGVIIVKVNDRVAKVIMK